MLNVMKFKDESTHEIACDAACSVQPVADIRPAECMSGSIRGGGAHKRNTDYEPALDCWTHTITHTHTHTHTHITDQPSIPCSDLPVWDAESSIAVKKISKVGAYANLLYDHTLASAFQNLCLAPHMKRYVFPPAHARRHPVE